MPLPLSASTMKYGIQFWLCFYGSGPENSTQPIHPSFEIKIVRNNYPTFHCVFSKYFTRITVLWTSNWSLVSITLNLTLYLRGKKKRKKGATVILHGSKVEWNGEESSELLFNRIIYYYINNAVVINCKVGRTTLEVKVENMLREWINIKFMTKGSNHYHVGPTAEYCHIINWYFS